MGDLFWLSEAQFEKIRPLSPDKTRGVQRETGLAIADDPQPLAELPER